MTVLCSANMTVTRSVPLGSLARLPSYTKWDAIICKNVLATSTHRSFSDARTWPNGCTYLMRTLFRKHVVLSGQRAQSFHTALMIA